MRTRLLLRFRNAHAVGALLVCCAASATAQGPEVARLNTVRPMTLHQTRYQLRAGESTRIDAQPETLDFLLHAKTWRVEIAGKEAHGLVVGTNRSGDQILLAASLRMKPGEYAVTLSAMTEAGEERVTTLALVLNPLQAVPSTATQPPVVLLNGWQAPSLSQLSTCPQSTPDQTFGEMASDLHTKYNVPVVYWFDNCVEGPDQPIEVLGNDLGQVLDLIQYDTGGLVPEIDVVSHSMGGLIARAYLVGLQNTNPPSFLPPPNPRVRKLTLIATPNFGSFLAGENSGFAEFGAQSTEMIPGSLFLWALNTWNQGTDDLRGVDALAIIGDLGTWPNATASPNTSDGVVSITSASLSFARNVSRTQILPYCHTDSSQPFVGMVIDCSGPAIASAPDTINAVGSFLVNNAPGWAIGETFVGYGQGGVYVGVEGSTQYVNDFTQIPQFDDVTLSQNPQAVIYYGDFLPAGQGTVQFTSTSLGSLQAIRTALPGTYTPLRVKAGPFISSVTPQQDISGQGLIVRSGNTITLNGYGFGQPCSVCGVFASGNALLSASSWSDGAISVYLPATPPGFVTIMVQAASGSDYINIMTAPPSVITVAPASLQFAYTVGGRLPAAQSLQITNNGGSVLALTATVGTASTGNWVAASLNSANTPATLSVLVNPSGLTAGTYTGSIQISATGASNSPVSIAVTLTIAAAPASLAIAPQALTFNYTVGGAAPAAQNISITNAGGGTLFWAASSGASWVVLSPASGTAPAALSVSVNPANLTAGSYSATVQTTAAGAGGSPASVGVTLVVQASAPAFTVALSTAGQVEPFAPESIVSAYGTNLATGTASATALPLPTMLAGTTVTVTDSTGVARLSPLFYVSATQVNCEIPAGVASGFAKVTIMNQNGTTQSAAIQIGNTSPGLFELNSSGLVAAWVLPLTSGIQGALQPVYQVVSDSVIPLPINLGPSTEETYLEMYGTGVRDALNVTATVGGLNVPVLFSGAAPGFPGEDQINIGPLPHALAGRGNVSVVTTADGHAANTVNVTIQ